MYMVVACRSYFNPRTPGGVRLSISFLVLGLSKISIHAPRVGCDFNKLYYGQTWEISIHAPRVGCDKKKRRTPSALSEFQSTHPGWGATGFDREKGFEKIHFNPRTPGGVRPTITAFGFARKQFQSTHPGWGATPSQGVYCEGRVDFNPRTPGGVRHALASTTIGGGVISIHAPRVGCDELASGLNVPILYFNPRTPGGVRLEKSEIHFFKKHYFNPRTPGGVRHKGGRKPKAQKGISIHAPRVGCDDFDRELRLKTPKFQSTHPGWGATPRFYGHARRGI